MLATPGKLASAPGWIYEIKYDGFRCLVCRHGDVVRLESRRGRDMSELFSELVAEVLPIPHDFVADAELVVLDAQGLRSGIACMGDTRSGIESRFSAPR